MALTVAQARGFLKARVGNWLTLQGIPAPADPTTPHALLDAAIVAGAEAAGAIVADVRVATDAELATVPDTGRRLALDVAELEALRAIRTNWTAVTAAVEGISSNESDLLRLLESAIAAKEAEIRAVHGIPVGGVPLATTAGTPRVGAMADDPCWRIPPSW